MTKKERKGHGRAFSGGISTRHETRKKYVEKASQALLVVFSTWSSEHKVSSLSLFCLCAVNFLALFLPQVARLLSLERKKAKGDGKRMKIQ